MKSTSRVYRTQYFDYLMDTGPKSPYGTSSESQSGPLITQVFLSDSFNDASYIRRLNHVLVTSISRIFLPGCTYLPISVIYGEHHKVPADLPFTLTSATDETLPRSNTTLPSADASMLNEVVYLTVPEKALASSETGSSHQGFSRSVSICAGAPHPSGNVRLQTQDSKVRPNPPQLSIFGLAP